MLTTLNDYVQAGAIASLCKYHDNIGGRDADWIPTAAFAYREFRSATPAIVESLIRMAKAARLAAACQSGLRPGECINCDIIPGTGDR